MLAFVAALGALLAAGCVGACRPAWYQPASINFELLTEDKRALVGGGDGLGTIRRIVSGASAHLVPGGLLAFEIGMGQDEAVNTLLQECHYKDIVFRKDLAGIPRIATASVDA